MSFTRQRSGRSDWARRQRSLSRRPSRAGNCSPAAGMPATYLSPWLPTDHSSPTRSPISANLPGLRVVNPNNPNSPGLTNEGKVVTGIDRAGRPVDHHGSRAGQGDRHRHHAQRRRARRRHQHHPARRTPTRNRLMSRATCSRRTRSRRISTEQSATERRHDPVQRADRPLGRQVDRAQRLRPDGPGHARRDQPTGIFLFGGVGVLSFDSIVQLKTPRSPRRRTRSSSAPEHAAQGPAVDLPQQYQQPGVQQHDRRTHRDHAAHDAVGPVHDQRRGPQLRHHLGRPGSGSAQGFQVYFPPVGTTGRTSVQATAIDNLNVHGSAKNFTVSRAPVPFSSENSGLNYLKKATFGGNADGVGLDVKGKIGKLKFKRGLGNPNGVFTAKSSSTGLLLPATIYGTPKARPAIRPPATWAARSAPRASTSSTSGGQRLRADGAEPELRPARGAGISDLCHRAPAYALTNAVVTTSGRSARPIFDGTSLNTEIKTGFDLTSYRGRAWRGRAAQPDRGAQGQAGT